MGTRKRTEFSRRMFWSFEEQEEFPLAHLLTSALPGARGQSGQTEVQTRRFCVGPSPRSAAHPSEPRLPQLQNGGDSHCLAGQREPGGAACSALARSPRERQAPPPPTVHVGKAVHHRKGEPCPGPARGSWRKAEHLPAGMGVGDSPGSGCSAAARRVDGAAFSACHPPDAGPREPGEVDQRRTPARPGGRSCPRGFLPPSF